MTRYITLNEIDAEEATWFLNLNGMRFDEGPVTERPSSERWRTGSTSTSRATHPMHTHLVTFQVVGRTPFNVEAYEEENEGAHGVPGGDPTPYATGPMEPPAPDERGFQDTVKADPRLLHDHPGQVRLADGVVAPQTYVHHCHIVEHEDNDMMRPFEVVS